MSRACLRADIVFDEMMTGPEEKEASILQTDPLFLDILFVFSSFFCVFTLSYYRGPLENCFVCFFLYVWLWLEG